MAQEVMASPARAQRVGLFAGPPVRLSWGAIIGGTVAALGVGLLLHALGFALGLTAIDPRNPSTFRASSIFTGIWSLVTSIIALFVGGMVASRGAGVITRSGAAMHGLVMWAFTTLVGTWLMLLLITNVIGGVVSVGKTAVRAGAGAVSAVQPADLARSLGIDADAALAPVNARLRAEGKPQVTADQLLNATRDVVQQGLKDGKLDRQKLVGALAANTALSRRDAQEVAARLEAQFGETRGRVGQAVKETARDVQTGALAAAEDTGKAFWGLFGALLLGMLAAVAGATIGVNKRQRLWSQAAPPPPTGGWPAEPFAGQPRTNP